MKTKKNVVGGFEKRIEDAIFEVYRKYDLGLKENQEKLKRICMDDILAHIHLKDEIKEDWQLEFYVIQTALMNI